MSIDDVPPEDGTATRPIWEALEAELRRESDDGDGQKAGILQLIARRLAAKALDGDLGAIKEIFERMDGKSVAGTAPVEPPGTGRPIVRKGTYRKLTIGRADQDLSELRRHLSRTRRSFEARRLD
jgi:hypothetical protein